MKKILFFTIVTLIVTSCAPDLRSPYVRYHGVIDYSEYSKQGFFITESNSVNFEYEPVGSVTAVVKGGWEVLGQETKTFNSNDDVYGSSNKTKTKYGRYISGNLEDAIEELYIASKDLGANGVINLNIISSNGEYVVSGMAIKRK